MTHHHAHHHHEHHHDHDHSGLRGFFREVFIPHTHDASDSIDDALTAHDEGVRAVKVSMVLMLLTTAAQALITWLSGSVALFADTVHNLSDALTAVPLWIAFALSRRPASPRYPYGLHRAEDLSGLFIVAMIALSAIVAGYQAIAGLISPRPIDNIGWVIAAGAVGFLGNEAVAIYRIRIGRRIGSAALVADGIHARTDGFTSLAVVLGAIGVLAGFPLADPLVGLLISAMIFVMLVGTIRSVGRRLLDGIEPHLLDTARTLLLTEPGVTAVPRVRLRWAGHGLFGDADIRTSGTSAREVADIAAAAEAALIRHLPHAKEIIVRATLDEGA